jgi:hypothetical protein
MGMLFHSLGFTSWRALFTRNIREFLEAAGVPLPALNPSLFDTLPCLENGVF